MPPPTSGEGPGPESDLPSALTLSGEARRHQSPEAPGAPEETVATRATSPDEQAGDEPQMRNFGEEIARRNALYTTISTPGDKRPQQEHRITDAVL